jgi:hypothetical protein
MDFSIFSSFLPEGLLSHFNIVDFGIVIYSKKGLFLYYLDEKTFFLKILIMNLSQKDLWTSIIQDFPIRGKLFI